MGDASDGEILARVRQAFADVPRPEHFTNHLHCPECAEHDALLQERNLETLSIQDVGSQGWNPITMASPDGFAYFLPALARLALEPMPENLDWYGYIILFELRWDGPRNKRWQRCSPNQRATVAALLEHLYTTRSDLIGTYQCSFELFEALEIWSDPGSD